MGMSTASRGRTIGGGRFRRPPMHEINVTPMVDVMLVLLIIFMVTAPLLTVGVPVDLPKTEAQQINESDEPLVISVNAGGVIFIQETEVDIETLVPRLIAITRANPETRIYIRGDRTLPYGTVMQIMGRTTAAGFTRVALITDLVIDGGAAADVVADPDGDEGE